MWRRDFTANMEGLLDCVEEGTVNWKTVVENFYPDLEKAVEAAEKELKEVKIEDEVTDVVCEECGRHMVIKYGPHGTLPGLPGLPGMPQYQALSGKNRRTLSQVRKGCGAAQNQEGKKILRL